ncbi:MAG: VTT domain-containing protein [Candidatus Woesearchaeota archaeon]
MNRRIKVVLGLMSIIIAISLVSLTIGKEIMDGQNPSLFYFGLINFLGYLFFLLLPVESLVPIYQAFGHDGLVLIIIAVATAILAQPINYAIGYLMSSEVIKGLIGLQKYEKAESYIQNYGRLAIFFFNLTPLSSSVLSLVAGMLRFKFRTLMLYSFLGLLIKYFTIVYLFKLFY